MTGDNKTDRVRINDEFGSNRMEMGMRMLASVILCLCGVLAGCHSAQQSDVATRVPRDQDYPRLLHREFKDSGFPVVGHLEARGETVTILSGPNGHLYTVRDRAGRVVLWEAEPEELRVQCPAWYNRTERGIPIAL